MTDAVLSSCILRKGWFDLVLLRMRLHGEEFDRAVIDHPSGAAVLPYDPVRRVALTIRESRAAVLLLGGAALPEGIAGVSDTESAAETARREALEEAGVRLHAVEAVGRVWMTPSTSTERVHLFLGEYCAGDRVAAGGGLAEEQEHVEVHEVPLAELWDQVVGGEIADAKTYMLLHALRLRRPELFHG